ncbi:MAG: hypothetical protein A2293_01345 [Elusimicrobia bacterium RIFOXYB2_FULL_49_7]|nr:MAG: hypothetical protein A2293_01345 [Elusimicrobia bacterium RIFOXYB2_FULL_49_7]
MPLLTIGQLARQAKVNVQTIYYYEKRGLIPSSLRTGNGHRRFPPATILRLLFIRKAKNYGFTLKEISALGCCFWKTRKDCRKGKKKITDKIEMLKKTSRKFVQHAEYLNKMLKLCANNCDRQNCSLLARFI